MAYRIALIPGDGIGPEVTAAAQRIVDATGVAVEWLPVIAGQTALDQVGAPLPPATLDMIRNTDATLKGPTATPSGTGFRSVNVEMRQKLKLYANYRPAKIDPRRAVALRRRRPDRRPREHRRPLQRARARGRARRRREPPRDHRAGLRADLPLRLRDRQAAGPQARHLRPQGEHPQAQRRPVPAHVPARRRRAIRRSRPTTASSTPPA